MTVVYIIGHVTHGPVKIGISGAPKARLADLQTAHHRKLEILASFPGGEEHEQAVHKLFLRHKLQGEWFRRSAEILQFMDMVNCGVAFSMIAERFAKQRSEPPPKPIVTKQERYRKFVEERVQERDAAKRRPDPRATAAMLTKAAAAAGHEVARIVIDDHTGSVTAYTGKSKLSTGPP